MNVAVLGASNKPQRYSYQAVELLLEKGHTPLPVHPKIPEVLGLKVTPSVADIDIDIDTITMYIAPVHSDHVADDIVAAGARRVIFNPGTENPPLADRLREAGAEVHEACTLVLLRTGQF